MDEDWEKEGADPLSYENLNRSLIRENKDMVKSGKYKALKGDDKHVGPKGFIFLYTSSKTNKNAITDENKKLAEMRLKFHVSLPENNREQFARGWNIVKNILIQNNIGTFKIVDENNTMSIDPSNGSQRGKDITIYFHLNPDKGLEFWQAIMQQITDELVIAGIPPGYRTEQEGKRNDKPISGSNYLSYRYERAEFPDEANDFGQKIIVVNPNQPEPTPWDPCQNYIKILNKIVWESNFWETKSKLSNDIPKGVQEIQTTLQKNISDTQKWQEIQQNVIKHTGKKLVGWLLQDNTTEELYQAIIENKPNKFLKKYENQLNVPTHSHKI